MSHVKAIINGIEETLTGIEARIYLLSGEKAVINRRKYMNQYYDCLSSVYKDNAKQHYTPHNTKDTVTYGIKEDDYE